MRLTLGNLRFVSVAIYQGMTRHIKMSRITLRKIQERDRKNAYELLFDTSVMAFLGPKRSLSSDEAKEWVDSEIECPSRYAIALKDSDELIGFCGIKDINGVLDFGYFFRKKYWGKGYATEACKLALNTLSNEVDLNSIEIFIDSTNSASQAVAQKLGWSIIKKAKKNGQIGHLYAINM